ncbi:alpha/beta hydrolase [Nocardia sp. BMG111209]|uniref:alpha/beta hydrolase n=1 Tax=Nocardia sp. BMG111209 TaxID=1160137 RepID=UPI000361CE19|nr:alpha/beta hydrolase [Nocardia sp. BMG111209]
MSGTDADIERMPGAVYREVVGFRPLEMDLYLPHHVSGDRPVIVYVHGGGWQRGSRRRALPVLGGDGPAFHSAVAARGFAVAAVDYRLSGEAIWPAAVDDLCAAVHWLRAENRRLRLDPDAIVLWGESAGAHLALLAALRRDDPLAVRGVVAWFPPTDLPGLPDDLRALHGATHEPDTSREDRFLGVPIAAAPDRARTASPLTHVHPEAPPILLAHGTADAHVPAAQSIRLASALRAVGAPVELDLIAGAGHFWDGAPDVPYLVDTALRFCRTVTGVPAISSARTVARDPVVAGSDPDDPRHDRPGRRRTGS